VTDMTLTTGPVDVANAPPPELLSWLADQQVCLAVEADRLHAVSLAPVAHPTMPHAAVAAIRRRKIDLLAFLHADHQLAPQVAQVPPAGLPDLARAVQKAARVGVEMTATGSPSPYRARAARLVLAIDPSTAFVLTSRLTNAVSLRDSLANVELVGWGPECARLGLMALLLITSDRPVIGLVPGAGLVVGDDDAAIAIAARRAAYAAAASC
jgi:hypothetical protein